MLYCTEHHFGIGPWAPAIGQAVHRNALRLALDRQVGLPLQALRAIIQSRIRSEHDLAVAHNNGTAGACAIRTGIQRQAGQSKSWLVMVVDTIATTIGCPGDHTLELRRVDGTSVKAQYPAEPAHQASTSR